MVGSPSGTIAIVGGSLAGLRTAEQLRVCKYEGPITVFGEERHLPYNRPPLSKEVLAGGAFDTTEAMAERLTFRRRASVANVDFRLGQPVVCADIAAGTLSLADGSTVAYEGLAIASGLRPRRLDVEGPNSGRHVLRTINDCLGLRKALTPRSRVVVIGGGFIGCEAAATLTKLGHTAVVVEPGGKPMSRVLGEQLGAAIRRHHEQRGVEFVVGSAVARYTGDDRISGVTLQDGRTVEADIALEAVGSVCNTEWLAGNGLDLHDGVLTGNDLAAHGAERTVAVGDVARFPNPLFDDVPRRVEHWSMPTDTAKRAAPTLAALVRGGMPDPSPFVPIPSFWSNQFDLRLQCFGSPALADAVSVDEGDLADLSSGLLVNYSRQGRLVGSVALNLPAQRQRELRLAFEALAPAL